jgi:dTDP-4-dehydrorhamnose 3,5-epimerase
VDLRPESATYLHHAAFYLTAENGRGVYLPERVAQGFITLEDNTEVTYLMGTSYVAGAQGGLAHDDPELGIAWPLPVEVISTRDMAWPALADTEADLRRRMAVALVAVA